MTREKNLHVLNTDKCFPRVSDRLVKSVDIELGVEGRWKFIWEVSWETLVENWGGKEPIENARYQASSCCGVGTAKACVTGDGGKPYRRRLQRSSPRGMKTWLSIKHSEYLLAGSTAGGEFNSPHTSISGESIEARSP